MPNDNGSRSNSSGLKIKLESRICNICDGLEEGDERMEEIKDDYLFLLELGTSGVSGMRKTQRATICSTKMKSSILAVMDACEKTVSVRVWILGTEI